MTFDFCSEWSFLRTEISFENEGRVVVGMIAGFHFGTVWQGCGAMDSHFFSIRHQGGTYWKWEGRAPARPFAPSVAQERDPPMYLLSLWASTIKDGGTFVITNVPPFIDRKPHRLRLPVHAG